MGILQGLLGNMSAVSNDSLKEEYGAYLIDNEEIISGYKLVRDVVIFTDKRIITCDKQGATGKKMRVDTIYLDTIINVSAETAGFGFDDSEISIFYIVSPYHKANTGVSVAEKKYEFPKSYNIQSLYRWLQEIAYNNHTRLNS